MISLQGLFFAIFVYFFFIFRPEKFRFLNDTTFVVDNTLDLVNDESFIKMEKLCEKTLCGKPVENVAEAELEVDLLKGVKVPEFNDTLEEVDFILSLGMKLKAEGKVNFPTPKVKINSYADRSKTDQMEARAETDPPTSLPGINKKRIPTEISPLAPSSLYLSCRSSVDTQVRNFLIFLTLFVADLDRLLAALHQPRFIDN